MRNIILICSIIALFSSGCAHHSERHGHSPPDAVTEPTQGGAKSALKSAGDDSEEFEKEKRDLENADSGFLEETASETDLTVADPIYPWNVAMFHFNDRLYFWVVEPLARGYKWVAPSPVRVGVKNFFQNVTTPVRLVNSLLQLKFRGAGDEFVRFVVNTTAGLCGFMDVAQKGLGMRPSDEDLGQTLGTYGLGNGFYIVWPLFGPSTLRDTFGRAGDYFLDPVHYVDPSYLSAGISGYRRLNDASLRLGEYEEFKETAFDPYVAFRNAYIQHRQSKVEK